MKMSNTFFKIWKKPRI